MKISQKTKEKTPKKQCPACGEENLQTIYTTKSRKWIRVGLYCPNEKCEYIKKVKGVI
jgi:hypothetical protein